jgi:hypothetical protein
VRQLDESTSIGCGTSHKSERTLGEVWMLLSRWEDTHKGLYAEIQHLSKSLPTTNSAPHNRYGHWFYLATLERPQIGVTYQIAPSSY